MKVILKDILNNKSYTEGGYALYALAEQAIEAGDLVYVDMLEVQSVPTLFMNTSFGDLILKYGIEATKKLFRFNNITKFQVSRIQDYFDKYQALLVR